MVDGTISEACPSSDRTLVEGVYVVLKRNPGADTKKGRSVSRNRSPPQLRSGTPSLISTAIKINLWK